MVNFNMRCSYKKKYLVLFFIGLTTLYGQECDSGFVWVEDVPVACGGAENCFFETDLNILQEIIDNSGETINILMDDNDDGIIHHVELGSTEWVNGHLVALDCYLSENLHCNLSGQLPENIGDLSHLEALWLNGNQLTGEIPESMGNLLSLELLYLSDNQFIGTIPESLCSLNIDWGGANSWGVEYFNIQNNQICPPYPDCMDLEIIGEQDTTFCFDNVGDVNDDGVLNILDIIIIANIILGTNENVPEADVNQDGELNILDIVTLANIILT